MKLFKKIRKGFTLIELVVVIAVIAILAAISVVSFISINNKAKESHDNQIIDQVNLSLKADETLNGKPKTMHRALEALKEDGFLPANFGDLRGTAKDYTFAYSLKENKFVALKGGKISYPSGVGEHANHELWKIAESTTGLNDGYSYYLRGEDKTGTVKVEAGFDVGDNKGITEIKYTNPTGNRNSVIRTDGGTLTINAPEDTVKHFGNADSVNIVKIANASYHENGTVPFIQVSQGRIEIESSGDVNTIHVANVQTVNSDESISKQSNVFSQDVSLTLNGKDVKLSRDTIGTAISSAVLVCEVQEQSSSSSEYIWLVGDGTIENHKVYVTSTSTAPNTSVDSTTTTDNASDAAIAIANNAINTGTAEDPVYEPKESGKSAEEAQVASALKGSGTEADPFQVYDFDTMQKINDFYELGYHYFEVALEKTDNGKIDCDNWIPVNINGSFDGKGVTFKSLNNYLFWNVGNNMSDSATFKNFNIQNCNIVLAKSAAAVARNVDDYGCKNLTLENVNITGYIEGQGQTASFIAYPGSGVLTFKNCTSAAKVVAIGDCAAGFVVNPYMMLSSFGGTSESKIVLDNSYFEGSLSTTKTTRYRDSGATSWAGTNAAGAYVYAHNISVPTEIIHENPSKTSLYVSQDREGMHERLWCNNDKVSAIVANNPSLDLSNVQYGQTFVMTKYSAEVSYATISMIVSPNNTQDTGSFTGTYFTERVEVTGNTFTSNIVRKYNVAINGSIDGSTLNQVSTNGKTGITSDGTTLNIVNSYYGYTHNGASIIIVQYNSSGDVIAYTSNAYIAKTTN